MGGLKADRGTGRDQGRGLLGALGAGCAANRRVLSLGDPSAFGPGHSALQLGLAHRRAAFYAELLGVVVELFAGAATGAAARTLAAAAARGAAAFRAAGRGFRFSRPRLFLVHGPSRDLLSPFLRTTGLFLALLDVLVLTSPFGPFFHSTRGHDWLLSSASPIPGS